MRARSGFSCSVALAALAGALLLHACPATGQHRGGRSGGGGFGSSREENGFGAVDRGHLSPMPVGRLQPMPLMSPRPSSTMRPGLQLGPPGRWWDDKHFAKDLQLRPRPAAPHGFDLRTEPPQPAQEPSGPPGRAESHGGAHPRQGARSAHPVRPDRPRRPRPARSSKRPTPASFCSSARRWSPTRSTGSNNTAESLHEAVLSPEAQPQTPSYPSGPFPTPSICHLDRRRSRSGETPVFPSPCRGRSCRPEQPVEGADRLRGTSA